MAALTLCAAVTPPWFLPTPPVQAAMSRTKKLCAVIVDTLGREVMVRRPCVFGTDGWPAHPGVSPAAHGG